MVAPRKSRQKSPPECKVPAAAAPADGPAFERDWHAAFLADALKTADIPGAMTRHKVGWGDYLRSRREHPVFGAACVELDMVIRHALWITLEAKAAAGDGKAVKLLNGGLDQLRADLLSLGIAGPGRRTEADPVPHVRVGGVALPQGPCACCARGLLILDKEPGDGRKGSARFQHVLVRHELARDLDLPGYPDKGHLPVVLGHVPPETGFPRGRVGPEPDPAFILPDHSGPTMAEIATRAAAVRAARESSKPAAGEPLYLPRELDPGAEPPAAVASRYQLGVSADGNGQTWRVRPEWREERFWPDGTPESERAYDPGVAGG